MCGAELHALPDGVQRVARALQDAAHPHAPVMLDGAARTAQEAADGLGVQLGQIAKSVIFKRKQDGVAVLVVASGDRRVDEKKVSALVGKIGRAEAAAEAREHQSDDWAQADAERDLAFALEERESAELVSIDEALKRIADGSYGLCVDCGASIATARLHASPTALRCVGCQEKAEKAQGNAPAHGY